MSDVNLEQLVYQMSADVAQLTKANVKALAIVKDHANKIQDTYDKAGKNAFSSFLNQTPNVSKALDRVFDSSRLKVLDTGIARIGLFGSALEDLGPAGLVAAGGIAATAVAVISVKKAMEEVGQLKVDADKLGVTVEQLQELQFAAKESHVPVQALDAALGGLSDTLGRLRSGVGAERLNKLAAELGLSPEVLAQIKTVDQLIPVLADHIRALPSFSEQYAAAAKAGAVEILPLLLKGSDGVRQLTAEYRSLGIEVSGEVAGKVAEGNVELEKAHDIAHDKLRNSLLDLQPIIVGLSTAWDDFAAKSVNAFTSASKGYEDFIKNAARLANQSSGNGHVDIGANLLGHFNLIAGQPMSALAAVFGSRSAQQRVWNGPSFAGPAGATAARTAAGATGPTQAQLAAELVAKQKLDELEAKYLTHTTSRLEAEKAIEEINAKRAAAGDKPLDAATQNKILSAASAEDAKRNRGKTPRTDVTQNKIDEAKAGEAQARAQLLEALLAQTTELDDQLALGQQITDAEKARVQAEADAKKKAIDEAKNIQGPEKAGIKARIQAAADDEKAAIATKAVRAAIETRLAYEQKVVSRLNASDEAEATLLDSQASLAKTLAARAALEAKALALRQHAELRTAGLNIDQAASTGSLDDLRAAQEAAINTLARQQQDRELQAKQNASPLHKFVDDAPTTIDRLNESFEQFEAEGLGNLNSGLADAIVNAKSLGDVGAQVFKQLAVEVLQVLFQAGEAKALAFLGFADGGAVRGPGGPRADVIPAMLSNGEFVVNAHAASRFRNLLEAINAGQAPHLAMGGSVGMLRSIGGPAMSGRAAAGGVTQHVYHLEGAYLTDDIWAEIRASEARATARGASGGYQMAMKRIQQSSRNALGRR